jgi:hypothetical protein
MSRVSMSTEPEALRLADALDAQVEVGGGDLRELKDASAELRRLALKQWVGLTDEDIHDAFNFTEVVKQLSWDREPVRWCENFSAYIEAKLKEKNT